MGKVIEIVSDGTVIASCTSVIIVPEIAINEAGYIKMHTIRDAANAKHEYHAMGQMAYFQYQDSELDIREMSSALMVNCGDEQISSSDGMVICRSLDGDFFVLLHAGQDSKKLLEAAYRYCTRWVRLDI